jgi:hypothetical protein
VKNEEVLHGVKEERNNLYIIRRGRLIGLATSCVGILWIEGTGRRRGRRKELLDDFTEKRGYWKLITEALDGFLLTAHCGRRY